MCSDLNTSGKLFKTLNKKRKDGLTVFAELNTGGELCKKDKLSSIFFLEILFVRNLSLRISLRMLYVLTKSGTCLVTQVLTRVIVYLLWELEWGCHPSLSMRVS